MRGYSLTGIKDASTTGHVATASDRLGGSLYWYNSGGGGYESAIFDVIYSPDPSALRFPWLNYSTITALATASGYLALDPISRFWTTQVRQAFSGANGTGLITTFFEI